MQTDCVPLLTDQLHSPIFSLCKRNDLKAFKVPVNKVSRYNDHIKILMFSHFFVVKISFSPGCWCVCVCFNFIFIVDTVTDVPISSPFAHFHPVLPLPSGHHQTVICGYGLWIYVFWLIPSPFIQSLFSPSLLKCVNLFDVSIPLVLFC